MKNSKRWEERRYEFLREDGSEMDDSEIADFWQRRGRTASARGTLFHYHCEAHCNGRAIENPHSPEFGMFLLLAAALREMGFAPFRTEVCLFHVGLCVAGQLDALFKNEADEQFALVDWKRCKSIVFDDSFRTLRPPLDNLAECNGSFYALQLNVYRYILESEYGCRIGENMFLGVCTPRYVSSLQGPPCTTEPSQMVIDLEWIRCNLVARV